jgi:UDPglucose--hexose-1-phosphate uridylyltransferase
VLDLKTAPHRRLNPLTGDWVLVSPHRTQRPWQGQTEAPAPEHRPAYDPQCYLCPGNERAGGIRNPAYSSTFVFANDFAALQPTSDESHLRDGLLQADAESGECRVVCFSPRHDLTLAQMDLDALGKVVDLWVDQFRELDDAGYGYVQIFENRGAMMGASNPHPHGQIWASRFIPNEIHKELVRQTEYWHSTGRTLLADYWDQEERLGERVVSQNGHFAAVVPFWAVWPYEVLVLAKRPVEGWIEMTPEERSGLAAILSEVVTRYDNLFQTSFPYSMGFHPRPHGHRPGWHFHAHFYPPLLRSATVRKFMVGYEMLGMPQRDITPEAAAERLRKLPSEHYLGVRG